MFGRLFIVALFIPLFCAGVGRDIHDVAYAPENGSFGLGDLYLPDELNENTPVVLTIHGGGWSAGDRASWSGVARFFRDEIGFAAFNIEYRLASPTNPWPACGNDCIHAAKWLLGSELERMSGLKPKKIWICGGSAGGHLALWTFVNLAPDEVVGVIAISPIGDPRIDAAVHADRYKRLGGGDVDLSDMDPCARIRSGMAPLLITHATRDTVVPIGSSRKFEKDFASLGNHVEFFEYADVIEPNQGGHCIWRPNENPHRLITSIERRIAGFTANGILQFDSIQCSANTNKGE